MTNVKNTSRRRPLLPAEKRTAWTRQDLLSLYPFSYNFWTKIPHAVLPYVRDGKNYVYDATDVVAVLDRLKRASLLTLIAEADVSQPKDRKRGRPRRSV